MTRKWDGSYMRRTRAVQGDENDIINGEWLEIKRNEKQPHMKISFWIINLSWRLWVIVGFYLYFFLPSISLSRYWICYNIASVVYVLGFWLQRHMGSSLPDQGSNSHPLHWKQSLNHWTTREVQRHCRLLNRGKDPLGVVLWMISVIMISRVQWSLAPRFLGKNSVFLFNIRAMNAHINHNGIKWDNFWELSKKQRWKCDHEYVISVILGNMNTTAHKIITSVTTTKNSQVLKTSHQYNKE